MRTKCKFCKWYKVGDVWISECKNEGSWNYGDECVEKDRAEPQVCDDKEEVGRWDIWQKAKE